MIVLEKLEDLEKYYNKEEKIYNFKESIKITFDLEIEAALKVAGDITARDITARNIDARDITALNITARDITARNIDARDITALNITAWNIDAGDITALNIDAGDIKYYAFIIAYYSFKCISTTAERENGVALCLDQPIYYKDKENK